MKAKGKNFGAKHWKIFGVISITGHFLGRGNIEVPKNSKSWTIFFTVKFFKFEYFFYAH